MKVDKSKWKKALCKDCVKNISTQEAIQKKDYSSSGSFPIISQEKEYISGFSNSSSSLNVGLGDVIIFGDHTRVLKYVDFDFCIGADGVKVLKPIQTITTKFLYYYLRWYDIPSNGYARHYKFLKEIEIKIPPFSEQQAIASELDAIQKIIDAYKAQLADLDALAQSVFLDTFGDPFENPYKSEKKCLKEICNINPSNHEVKYGDDNDILVSFLPMSDLDINALHFTPKQNVRYLEAKGSYTYFANGDVIMAKVTPCFENGKIGIATNLTNNVGFGSSEFLVYRPLSCLHPVYLYYVLSSKSIRDFGHNNLNGVSGLRRLTKRVSHNLLIPIPPIDLQQQFAEQVEAIEKQKDLLREQLKDAETLMAERMQYYFS